MAVTAPSPALAQGAPEVKPAPGKSSIAPTAAVSRAAPGPERASAFVPAMGADDPAAHRGMFARSGRLLRAGALTVEHGDPSWFGVNFAPTRFMQLEAYGRLPLSLGIPAAAGAVTSLGLSAGPAHAALWGHLEGYGSTASQPTRLYGGAGAAAQLCFDAACQIAASLSLEVWRGPRTDLLMGGLLVMRTSADSPLSFFIEPRVVANLSQVQEVRAMGLLGVRLADRYGAIDLTVVRLGDKVGRTAGFRLTLALL